MVVGIIQLRALLSRIEEPATIAFFSCLLVLWGKFQYPFYINYLVNSKISFSIILAIVILPTFAVIGKTISNTPHLTRVIRVFLLASISNIPLPHLSLWIWLALVSGFIISSLNATTRLFYCAFIIILYLLSLGGLASCCAIILTMCNLLIYAYLEQYKNFLVGALYNCAIIAIVLRGITPR